MKKLELFSLQSIPYHRELVGDVGCCLLETTNYMKGDQAEREDQVEGRTTNIKH